MDDPRKAQAAELKHLQQSADKGRESAGWTALVRATRIANHLPERVRSLLEGA